MDAGAKTLDLRLRGDDGCSILRFPSVPFPVPVSNPQPPNAERQSALALPAIPPPLERPRRHDIASTRPAASSSLPMSRFPLVPSVRIPSLVLPAMSALLLGACASGPRTATEQPPPPPEPREIAAIGTHTNAIANLASASGSLVSGRMLLTATGDGVRVRGQVGGLVPHGAHGLQVHERGNCSAVDARSAGRYYDPLAGARQDG